MKRIATCALAWLGLAVWCGAQEQYPYCQILDRADEPAWQARVGYVESSKVRDPNGKDFSMYELRGGGGLYYWRTGAGDIDLSGAYDIIEFDGNGGVNLPDRVGALRLDAAYVWRNPDGTAVKVDLYPGVYSDLRDPGLEDLAVPFQVLGIQAFNPQISGLLGVEIFPGFARSFDPRFGIRYAVSDQLSLDLMYPESRIVFRPEANWDLYAGIRNDPNAEYHLEDSDARDAFHYEEARLYVGANAPVSDVLRVMGQAGLVFNRSVDFRRDQSSRDVDNGYYFSLGLGGAL